MINLSINWIVDTLNANLYQANSFQNIDDYYCTSVSIDSRTMLKGALFFAIKGPNFDGHDFIIDIATNFSATACIVEYPIVDASILQIVVPCCRQALKTLAKSYRKLLTGKVIAITGSNGKTSTKNMLVKICNIAGLTSATRGNFNNQLGLPLTVLNTPEDSEFIILELGTGAKGEMAQLTDICVPDITLITNAGHSHLENLNTVADVAKEKGAIISNAHATAITILNQDDQYYNYWHDLASTNSNNENNKIISFSLHNSQADIFCSDCIKTANGVEFTLHIKQDKYPAVLPAWGDHQVINSCGVTAAAMAVGINNATIISGLAKINLATGRGKRHAFANGSLLIDESYNANPESVMAAIKQLSEYKSAHTIMVLGDMIGLGKNSIKYHEDLGKFALQQGLSELLTIGYFSKFACEKFGGKHFINKLDLINVLENKLNEKVVILIKGSNKMALLEIVNALLNKDKGEIKCCYG